MRSLIAPSSVSMTHLGWSTSYFTPEDINQVADVVMRSITAQHHDNDLIRSYFKYAQLEL